MTEEYGGFDESMDTQQSTEGSGEAVSQAEIARVRESIGNARKVAGQKAKSQRTNRQLALMLSFIFKYVEDEDLLSFVYTEMTGDHIHIIALFGMFLPHLQERMDIAPYKSLYNDVRDNLATREWTQDHLVRYFGELLQEFPELQTIDRKRFVKMIRRWEKLFISSKVNEISDLEYVKLLYT